MSIIQIQKTRCINAFCKNDLSEFELKRLCPFFSKYRFCRSCRGRGTTSMSTICVTCGERINNNTARLYCVICIKKRKNQNTLLNYYSKKKPKRKSVKTETVIQFLKENKMVTCKKISKELGMSPGAVRTSIYNLKRHHGKNIQVGYMLQ